MTGMEVFYRETYAAGAAMRLGESRYSAGLDVIANVAQRSEAISFIDRFVLMGKEIASLASSLAMTV
jgi:hypothetical protein